jgi:Tol biopolymer transport system component
VLPVAARTSEASVDALTNPTVQTRGGTYRIEHTTLKNVSISKKVGYGGVLVQFSRECLEFWNSPESFAMLLAVLIGGAAITWWLAVVFGNPPSAVFFTIMFLVFGIRPFFWGLLDQKRIRMDRRSDTVRIRELFRARTLCRLGDIVAVQFVGDSSRIEANLVFGDRPRFNLAALKAADDHRRMLQHAQHVAEFLQVPLVDQVVAKAFVGPVEPVGPVVREPSGIVRFPKPSMVAGDQQPVSSPLNSRIARFGKPLLALGFAAALVVWGLPAIKKALIHDPILGMAFSPDGKRLATVSFDPRLDVSTVTVWEAATGQVMRTLKGPSGLVESVAFSPDGTRLASAGKWIVNVWDVMTGQEMLTLKHDRSSAHTVTFSSDGKWLASASSIYDVSVWDATSGHEIRTLKHASPVDSVAFSPDSKHLASAGRGGTLKVWEAGSGEEILTIPSGAVWSVAYRPDGKFLASADSRGTVTVRDAATGKTTRTLAGHAKTVKSVVYSPDGRRLASASEDRTVKVWDAINGQEELTFKGHSGDVSSVAFSPDGKRLASASEDGSVKVWDPATGQVIQTLK